MGRGRDGEAAPPWWGDPSPKSTISHQVDHRPLMTKTEIAAGIIGLTLPNGSKLLTDVNALSAPAPPPPRRQPAGEVCSLRDRCGIGAEGG